ncbi:MAG: MotA/TolQ/ExbB proton channel family protein [Phycisphaerales bacterium]
MDGPSNPATDRRRTSLESSGGGGGGGGGRSGGSGTAGTPPSRTAPPNSAVGIPGLRWLRHVAAWPLAARVTAALVAATLMAGLSIAAGSAFGRSASAQPPAVAAGDAAAAIDAVTRDAPSSFGSAFFISRRMGADGTDAGIELLGSLVIWLLLVMSAISIGLIVQMVMANRREAIMPSTVFLSLRDLLRGGRYREAIDVAERDRSFFGEIVASALREAGHGWPAMMHGLDQRSEELAADRLRRIEVLNVLGQVSPMIGLFGTVYGMILAFQAIVVGGGNADPVLLAGGIGTALTTTFWGLVVAIPALAGYALVRTMMDARTVEAALTAEEMLGLFRPDAPAIPAAPGRGTAGSATPNPERTRAAGRSTSAPPPSSGASDSPESKS